MRAYRRPAIGYLFAFSLALPCLVYSAAPFKEHSYGYAGTVPVSSDYDGDGKDDLAVFYPPTALWQIYRSSLGQLDVTFGNSTMTPISRDYDGDGKTDLAVFEPTGAKWHRIFSANGFYTNTSFGNSAMKLVPGDYDGDGKADLAMFEPGPAKWHRILSANNFYTNTVFGNSNMIPVQEDYDGDGKTDIAMFYPAEAKWHILQTFSGYTYRVYGYAGPTPAPADFDGDGLADMGLFNTNSRVFHTFQSTRGSYDITFPTSGIASPSDFEGDGQKKLVVYRAAIGKWFADMTFVDWDLDGLSTSWELQNSLNDHDDGSGSIDNGPEGDPDADGYLNIYEFKGGSNPRNAASIPAPTVTVSQGGASIQSAIDGITQPYSIIRVGPGTYTGGGNRNITFRGKKIMLVSQSGASVTTIDADGLGRGFCFTNSETRQTVLSGFTIKDGSADDGAGIYCVTSSPTVSLCAMVNCLSTDSGGGLYAGGSSPWIVDCEFRFNQAVRGGAIRAEPFYLPYSGAIAASPVILRCSISQNSAESGGAMQFTGSQVVACKPAIDRARIIGNKSKSVTAGGTLYFEGNVQATANNCFIARNRGGGVVCLNATSVVIKHSTIVDNLAVSSSVGAGVFCAANPPGSAPASVLLRNSIVWGNVPNTHQAFANDSPTPLVVDYCDVDKTTLPPVANYATYLNTMEVDPLIAPSGRLKAGSPAINAGNVNYSVSPDLDGEIRGAAPDFGSDERLDADNDTLPDSWEAKYGLSTSIYNNPSSDLDGDGLTNLQESEIDTNPSSGDTDQDQLSDADEVAAQTDPLNADTDGDGISDGQEVQSGTNPKNPDSDGDGIKDGEDANPISNATAPDVELYVDCEGGAAGADIPGEKTVIIPQGTKAVYYKVTVFSREYPVFTSTGSDYNDVVAWSLDAPAPLQDEPLTPYNVNSLHNQFGAGNFPGGNVVIDEGVLDFTSLAASGDSSLDLYATAKNVSDHLLGSGIAIQVSILNVDLDIRETAQPQNRVGRDDPRILARVRNRILVWANSGANTVTFDLIKPPDITSPVWIQIEDQTGLNSGMPHFERLDAASATFTYTVADDNDDPDLLVRYGADFNSDSTLSGTDEIKGTYEVYGVTAKDYAESRNNYNLFYLFGSLYDLADQLHKRFANGAFGSGDFQPTTTSGSATLNATRLTHYFGANLTDAGFVTLAGRQYYAATATFPIYHYADNSDASELIRESSQLKDGLDAFVASLSHATVAAAYAAAPGGATRSVTFSLDGRTFQFGPAGSIGLGGVGVNSAEPYSSAGTITLQITLTGSNYAIGTDATTDLTVHDIFDFDYFTTGWLAGFSDSSQSAAMIQNGFGKTGSVTNAGQVGLAEVEVEGSVTITGRTVTP